MCRQKWDRYPLGAFRPGQILSRRLKQRQWQLIARGLSDEQLAVLKSHENVREVEILSTNLEEIFIAYMQQENGAVRQTAAKEDSIP